MTRKFRRAEMEAECKKHSLVLPVSFPSSGLTPKSGRTRRGAGQSAHFFRRI